MAWCRQATSHCMNKCWRKPMSLYDATRPQWVNVQNFPPELVNCRHNNDVIMSAMAFQITSLTIVYSTVYSGADQRKLHSSASLAFVRAIHRWPVNSRHKWPVMQKMFPLDDVIMIAFASSHVENVLVNFLTLILHHIGKTSFQHENLRHIISDHGFPVEILDEMTCISRNDRTHNSEKPIYASTLWKHCSAIWKINIFENHLLAHVNMKQSWYGKEKQTWYRMIHK